MSVSVEDGGTNHPRAIAPLLWPSDVELILPGSKSEANRLLVAAACAGRRVRITGATPCDDVERMVMGLQVLGFPARFVDRERGVVDVEPRPTSARREGTLDCGNAGTALRFLVSLAAVTDGRWTLDGDAAMRRRPIGPLVEAWRRLGIAIEDHAGCPPVTVRGGARRGGRVELDASLSSQFLSSLVLVGGELDGGLEIVLRGELASSEYAHLTGALLAPLGVEVAFEDSRVLVRRVAPFAVPDLVVSGDWSAAATWACAESLTGSRIRGSNLRPHSGQADEAIGEALRVLVAPGAIELSVAHTPDQFMNLAIVAARRSSNTRLVGARNLRVKESDRIAVMARELRKVGADVHELDDGLEITGGAPIHGATIDPENDHRVAMAFAILGLVVPGITITNPRCVEKSYPSFWRALEAVQRSLRCVAIIGMRGAGKSTLGRALAERSGMRWIDTDLEFEREHGEIATFVAAHGWPKFREIEARIVQRSLCPGTIVSTGGGAVENAETREALRRDAIVLSLLADAPLLQSRLRSDARVRPALSPGRVDPSAEIQSVLERRKPLYAEVAHAELSASLAPTELVAAAFEALRAPHGTWR